MAGKNLWIAYSDSEDLDADMKDAVEDKLLYTEVCSDILSHNEYFRHCSFLPPFL